jgi:glyoxylase-like metal-dependent hydrolase (beta-lactamase superfamily II)
MGRCASAVVVAALVVTGCAAEPPQSEAPAPEAAAPATAGDDVRAFAIGRWSAMALRDRALRFPNDASIFGMGRTSEEVATLLAAEGLPTHELRLSVQPLLVRAGERVLLFDAGTGGNMGEGSGTLLSSLASAGLSPGSVTDVFVSHAHGDHVGGLVTADGALAFPNAVIHIASPEWAFLREMDEATAAAVVIPRHTAFVSALAPKVADFAPGSELIPGVVTAVDIRGHSPGHSGYLITSGDDSLLYIGDAMHHVVVSVQRPDWPNQFDGDRTLAAASRSELLATSVERAQRIHAVHFPFPGVGRFERRGGGFVWVPE